jgi:hypothetical protein
MAITTIRGKQVLDASIQRADLDTVTVGQAVVAKLIQGTNVSLSSTGADAGTGDVTVSVPGGGVGPTGQPAYTTSTAGFTVPTVGSSVTVNVNDTSWVALGETLWVQDAGGAGVAGAMQVTAKTSSSLTLLNQYV